MVDSRLDLESAPGESHGLEHPVLRVSKASAPPGMRCFGLRFMASFVLSDIALVGRLGDAVEIESQLRLSWCDMICDCAVQIG